MFTTAPSATPTVACILVNWNGWADTIACLDSLAQQDYPALHVIVVDNGSTNDSVDRIRASHPQIEIIETHANLGFAAGCNAGMRSAVKHRADYLWLLNNDTIAPPDTCSKLVAKALANPHAGIIGSVLYFLHDPTRVQAWGGGTVHPWIGLSTHNEASAPIGPHTYFTFARGLLPRPVVEHVGVLYEGFFMYWDDSDYALRVTRAGYTLAIAEDTAILHKEGASSGPRSTSTDRYSAASGLHFLRRHSPAPLLSMSIFITIRITSRAVRGQWKNLRAVLHGVRDYRAQRHIAYTDKL